MNPASKSYLRAWLRWTYAVNQYPLQYIICLASWFDTRFYKFRVWDWIVGLKYIRIDIPYGWLFSRISITPQNPTLRTGGRCSCSLGGLFDT